MDLYLLFKFKKGKEHSVLSSTLKAFDLEGNLLYDTFSTEESTYFHNLLILSRANNVPADASSLKKKFIDISFFNDFNQFEYFCFKLKIQNNLKTTV